MKIVAVLDVDEKLLAETGNSFEEEMEWVVQSGITLSNYCAADKCSEYEYAAFCWNTKSKMYEQMGRPVMNERLCKARYKEFVDKGWFNECYDIAKVIFKRRLVSVLYADWEE